LLEATGGFEAPIGVSHFGGPANIWVHERRVARLLLRFARPPIVVLQWLMYALLSHTRQDEAEGNGDWQFSERETMTATGRQLGEDHSPSGFALVFAFVAAALLIVTGLIIFVYALFDQLRTTDIIFNIRPSTWRVLMLLGGAGLVLAGGNLFVGKYWARAVGLAMAALVLVGAVLNLETETFFAIALIVLNLAIVYALGFRWTDIEEIVG
jgi:hypothetical protein